MDLEKEQNINTQNYPLAIKKKKKKEKIIFAWHFLMF